MNFDPCWYQGRRQITRIRMMQSKLKTTRNHSPIHDQQAELHNLQDDDVMAVITALLQRHYAAFLQVS